MAWYGKTTFLVYGERTVANYKIYCENGDECEVELNLYYPFNRHRVILDRVKLNDVDNAVLDYMKYEFLCNVENCNMLQAYEVIEYFKSQIGEDGK